MSVRYFTEGGAAHPFPKLKSRYTGWLEKIAASEHASIFQLSYIFCTDAYLLDINIRYLGHDDYTDIITFPYSEGTTVSGDIFISLERIADNATFYSCTFEEELRRVMAHGLLHLLGYKDKEEEQIQAMRAAEERSLALFEAE